MKAVIIILIILAVLFLLYLLCLRCRRGHADWARFRQWRYAHRGLHNKEKGIPENSMAAFKLAAASASALPRSAFSSTISGARSTNSGSTSSSRGIRCSVPSSR